MSWKPLKSLLLAASALGVTATAAHGQDCRLGISMYTLGAPYFAAQEQAARLAAEEAGCDVLTADAQNDMVMQIGDVEDLVAGGINILILNPRDPQGLVPAVNAASADGVHVVIIDSSLDPSADFITLIQSSNQANGELVGDWLASHMSGTPMQIALISGDPGNVVGRDRRLGVIRGLVDAQLTQEGRTNFQVVGQGWGGWSTEGGLDAMEDLLVAHPDVNVVLGENDSMVLGARAALQAAGRLEDVVLVAAADGQKEALELIRDGEYGATGLNNPSLIARTAVDVGLQALRGELPEEMPRITFTEPAAITQENVDQFYDENSVF